MLIKRAALGNLKASFHCTHWHRFFPLKKACFYLSVSPARKDFFSKTYPSFLTVKEGSTSHLGLLSSGEKKETALLGARNRYAIRLADHQRSSPCCAGWDRMGEILAVTIYQTKKIIHIWTVYILKTSFNFFTLKSL